MSARRTYYKATVAVNGLSAGDVVWFDKDFPKTKSDEAAIKSGLYVKVKKPEWM